MNAIIGLGNSGNKYFKNRHNTGFMFVEYMLSLELFSNCVQRKRRYYIEYRDRNSKLLFVKPETFMNNSGSAVLNVIEKYNLDPSRNIVIVHDDLDIPIGVYKLQFAKGPIKHNGILDIENRIRTDKFYRLRIGIENRTIQNRIEGEKYVLQNFKSDELKLIKESFKKAKDSLIDFLNGTG